MNEDSMALKLDQIAIVVTERGPNSALGLSPFSLHRRGILPDEARILDGSSAVPIGSIESEDDSPPTPIYMFEIKCHPNINIDCSPGRIMFAETSPDLQQSGEIAISKIANHYIQAAPPNQYTAIGINITSTMDIAGSARSILLNKLIKNDSWSNFSGSIEMSGTTIAFKVPDCTMNLQIYPGKDTGTRGEIKFGANIHRDIREADARQRVLDVIQNIRQDIVLFQDVVEKNFLRSLVQS